MRKAAFLIGLPLLLLLGMLLSLQHFFPRWGERLSLLKQETRNSSSAQRLPLVPSVSLQINDTKQLATYVGSPLVLCVTFGNHAAMSAALQNQTEKIYRRSIQSRLSRGEISSQQADHLLASLHTREVSVIRLGSESENWGQFVHLMLQRPNGKEEALQWPLKLTEPPPANSVILDDKTTPQLFYLLDPLAASHISPGQYRVVAVLEVKDDAKLSADRWRGRAESEPVSFSIIPKPAHLTPAQEEETALQFARYYKAAKGWPLALEFAQKALVANPDSIASLILVGDVKEAQGDQWGALEAYQTAKNEFYAQYPKSYEAPEYLTEKTASLSGQLRQQR